ncbi:extracellular solute-binding protein [Paenibacillus chartarius]|uniref:Extracellular solute-binding protein n=1 Tax=Paenibacillus chartarius TaxID=747481 RepID=A0ABV6DPL3_9BACL
MRKSSFNMLASTSLTLVMTASLLAACGGGTNESGGTTPAPAADGGKAASSSGPLQIAMMLDFSGKEQPKPDNPVLKEIEKYTNTKLNITQIPSNDYCAKLPVVIASGDMPEVVASCGTPNQPYLINAVQGGAFWDITPYLKDYPNLSKMPQVSYDNIKIGGKIYGIPRYRPISRYVFTYRQDWLNNLGMKPPTTVDEFYNMLKAFTTGDPDKNGKNDTYGVSSMISNTSFSPDFGLMFGAPNNWAVKDGKFIKAEETPEYLDGLKFAKKLYDEKLLNQDFATVDRPKYEGEFENGKAGVINATTNNMLAFEARVQAHNKDAKIDGVSALEGPKGKRTQADRGSNGILMFPKAKVKSEAQLKQLLGFFDKLSDKPMADLFEWGIPGTHYEVKDGKAIRTNQQAYDNEVRFPYSLLLQTVPVADIKTPGTVDPTTQRSLNIEADNAKYAVIDPAMVLISDTWNKQGQELLQILNDAKVKFVMGKIDENGWNQAVAQYKKAGGDKAAQELAAEYAKLPAK